METEVITTIDLLSSSNNGTFTLPARKTIDIVRNFPNFSEIKITYQENYQVIIFSGLSKFILSSLDFKLFPVFNEDESDDQN